MSSLLKTAILHGAGYVGRTTAGLIIQHPQLELCAVTSRSFDGQPLWTLHPNLRGKTDVLFSAPDAIDYADYDVIFITAGHGEAANLVKGILEGGYSGKIIDLSTDFRLQDASLYPKWFKFEHPAPELLPKFVYGLTEINREQVASAQYIANPGCFATALNLALYPISQHLKGFHASITAMTGASGSGNKASATTHFPDRYGNVRAYKTFAHQHQTELDLVCGNDFSYAFVPVSAPWTFGIWGTIHIQSDTLPTVESVGNWYEAAYGDAPLIRLWGNQLPQLLPVVQSPFADLGWAHNGTDLVIGVAIDNTMKGAASQAIQNLNVMMGWNETLGLI